MTEESPTKRRKLHPLQPATTTNETTKMTTTSSTTASGLTSTHRLEQEELFTNQDVENWLQFVHQTEMDEENDLSSTVRRIRHEQLGELLLKHRPIATEPNKLRRICWSKVNPSISSLHPSHTFSVNQLDQPETSFGCLAHEYHILRHLHAHTVNCVPNLIILITDYESGMEISLQSFIDASPLCSGNIVHTGVTTAVIHELHRLHSAGVVHADLKPEHILIKSTEESSNDSFPSVYFVDFDLAHRSESRLFSSTSSSSSSSTSLQHPHSFRGTPAYASLLIHLGCLPSPATDYESLIWILLELLAQRQSSSYRLPWRQDGDESATAEPTHPSSNENPFEELANWLDQQRGWSLPYIHYAAKQKLIFLLTGELPQMTIVPQLKSILPQLLQLITLSYTQDSQSWSLALKIISEFGRDSPVSIQSQTDSTAPLQPPPIDIKQIECELHLSITSPLGRSSSELLTPVAASTTPTDLQSKLIFLPRTADSEAEAESHHCGPFHLIRVCPPPLSTTHQDPIEAEEILKIASSMMILRAWTRLEGECQRYLESIHGHDCAPTVILTSNVLIVFQLPDSIDLGEFSEFLCAVFSSTQLFALPLVHIAILLGRFLTIHSSSSSDAFNSSELSHDAELLQQLLGDFRPPTSNSSVAQSSSRALESTSTNVTPPSSIMRLAQVEIQAVMQFLLEVELIRFSRCSRTLLADGDSDVAWKFQPLFEFSFTPTTAERFISTEATGANHAFRTSSILMRHQPAFGIVVGSDEEDVDDWSEPEDEDEDMSGTSVPRTTTLPFFLSIFDAIPRIKRMTLTYVNHLSVDEWLQVFNNSHLDHLVELHIDPPMCGLRMTKRFGAFQRMPLTALTMSNYFDGELDSVIGLRSLPRLTHLSLIDGEVKDGTGTVAMNLISCEAHIVKLEIRNLIVNQTNGQFHQIFTSPSLSHLVDLNIHSWMIDPHRLTYRLNPSQLDYLRLTWKSMTCLTHLTLKEIVDINTLLSTIPSSPSLQHLHYQVTHYTTVGSHPKPAAVRELLDQTTSLTFELSQHLTASELTQYQLLQTKYPTRFVHRKQLLWGRSPAKTL